LIAELTRSSLEGPVDIRSEVPAIKNEVLTQAGYVLIELQLVLVERVALRRTAVQDRCVAKRIGELMRQGSLPGCIDTFEDDQQVIRPFTGC
jgi:hypothetical protein